jgi:hypothetical protein
MALPAAQRQRKQQLQEQLTETLDKNAPRPAAENDPELDISAFAVVDGKNNPAEDAPPTPPTPTVNWEEEARKSEQRWRTLQGLYDRERADRETLAVRLAQVESASAAPVQQEFGFTPGMFDDNSPELDLTEDEQRTYAESLGVIQKAAKREAMKLVKSAVEPLTREIQQLRGASQKFEDMNERTFLSNVKNRVPDMDSIVASEAWKDYTRQRVPFTQLTVGDALMQAHNARNFDSVVEILEGFRGTNVSNAKAALTAPAVTGAAPIPRQQGNSKPKLRWSERTKAHDMFIKGNITHEKLRQIDALYKEADAEGRIDYNS